MKQEQSALKPREDLAGQPLQPAPGPNAGKEQVRRLTLAALLTAVVVVLALLGSAIHFGTFSINLALVPIVIGAALLGQSYGAWFGLVNALVILLSGDAAPFFTISVFGTIVTVVAKGVLAGLAAGAVYRLFQGINKYAAVILAALVCPLVNTGVFLLGCLVFFWGTLGQWAESASMGSTFTYVIVGLVGVNFLLEVAINVVLAPVIARILGFSEDKDTALIVYGSVLAVVGLGFVIFAMLLLRSAWFVAKGSGGFSAPGGRYVVMAACSDLVLIGGAALIAVGINRKKNRK